MSNASGTSNEFRLVAYKVTADFSPDGDLEKDAWQRASRVSLVDTLDARRSHPGAATEVAACWSPAFLYVAFWCRYTDLNVYWGEDPQQERWELWNRDVVEVFLTPFPQTLHRYWEFEVAPNDQWIDLAVEKRDDIRLDAAWNSGFEHRCTVDADTQRWTCEMRIPSAALGLPQIERGTEWRINFYRCDGPGEDSQRRFLAWSPTLQLNFHVPERFGWVRMEIAE
ncbi:MAG: hypothetical protein FJW26_05525 [Acidimicrobiia bacterium]|nr:hypothetical protein [Acidimicrobiia bacterium]